MQKSKGLHAQFLQAWHEAPDDCYAQASAEYSAWGAGTGKIGHYLRMISIIQYVFSPSLRIGLAQQQYRQYRPMLRVLRQVPTAHQLLHCCHGPLSTQVSRPQLQKLRLKARNLEKVVDMNAFYSQELNDKLSDPRVFALGCRELSRVMRRQRLLQKINVDLIFGEGFGYCAGIEPKYLSESQLIDIVSLFNIITVKTYIDIENPVLSKFINGLLTALKHKFEQSRQSDRDPSYITKALRCAQLFMSPLYSYFLAETLSIYNNAQPYDFISLFQHLTQGRPSTIDTLNETKLIQASCRKILDQKWIESTSVHTYLDIQSPILPLVGQYPHLREIIAMVEQMNNEVDDFLGRYYQKLTTEEIIRIQKYLSKNNRRYPNSDKIIRLVFSSIKDDGSTSLDPIYIMRLVQFVKKSDWHSYDPLWEEKYMKVLQFYFVNNGVNTRFIFDGLVNLVDAQTFSPQNTRLIVSYLFRFMDASSSHDNSPKFFALKYLNLFKIVLQEHMYKQCHQLLMKMQQLQNKNKRFMTCMSYLAFMEFNLQYLRQNGIKNAKSIMDNYSKKLLSKINNRQTDVNKRLLKFYTDFARTKIKPPDRIDPRLYESLILTLPLRNDYAQVLQLLSSLQLSKSQTETLFIALCKLPLPLQTQPLAREFLSRKMGSLANCAYFYYLNLREIKNTDMQCSRLQCQFFLGFVDGLEMDRRVAVYANNRVIRMMVVYDFEGFVGRLEQLKGDVGMLWVRVLAVLVAGSDDVGCIRRVVARIEQMGLVGEARGYYDSLVHDRSIFYLFRDTLEGLAPTQQPLYSLLHALHSTTVTPQLLYSLSSLSSMPALPLFRLLRSLIPSRPPYQPLLVTQILSLLPSMPPHWTLLAARTLCELNWPLGDLQHRVRQIVKRKGLWMGEIDAGLVAEIGEMVHRVDSSGSRGSEGKAE